MYTLRIFSNPKSRQHLLDMGQKVVLARKMATGGPYLVATAVFFPFGDVVVVEARPEWKLFATPKQPRNWENLRMQNLFPANIGRLYWLENLGFVQKGDAYDERLIGLRNKRDGNQGRKVTCGLAQHIEADGESVFRPVTFCSLPYNQSIFFDPEQEWLVFVAGGLQPGMVIPARAIPPIQGQDTLSRHTLTFSSSRILGPYLKVPSNQNVDIEFDPDLGGFQEKQQ